MTMLVASSLYGVVVLFHPVAGFQDFAGFGAVGWAYDAVFFHKVYEAGGAAVAYAEATLQR